MDGHTIPNRIVNTMIKKATRATRAAIEAGTTCTGLEANLATLRGFRSCETCGASPAKDPTVKIVFCKACNLK